ncbi:MAG: hypothetical protein HUK08_05940 [Bacteroidaceae bacterium]|nr:hypothetical protein [Bacteroidaceae bacterium]
MCKSFLKAGAGKMTARVLRMFIMLCVCPAMLFLGSCSKNEDDPPKPQTIDPDRQPANSQTVFIYNPYSGLKRYLDNDLAEMETAIMNNNGLGRVRVLRFVSEDSRDKSHLMEIKYDPYVYNKQGVRVGAIVRDTIRTYDFNTLNYTEESGLTQLMNDVMTIAPSTDYQVILGSHASAWLPRDYSRSYGAAVNDPYGAKYQANYTTLAAALKKTFARNKKLKSILLDNCNSMCVEVAYDLKDVTDYIVGSETEILMNGMPYDKLLIDYIMGDYVAVLDAYYDYYKKDQGTIAIVSCDKMDGMAEVMKEINSKFTFDESLRDSLQIVGGTNVSNPEFYDFGRYVEVLINDKDPSLYDAFYAMWDAMVPDYIYTNSLYWQAYPFSSHVYPLTHCSGIGCSDPAKRSQTTAALKETAWYKATH